MGIVFIYAVLVMKGITYTQIAQYVVLIFAYTVPAVYLFGLTDNPFRSSVLGPPWGRTPTYLTDLTKS